VYLLVENGENMKKKTLAATLVFLAMLMVARVNAQHDGHEHSSNQQPAPPKDIETSTTAMSSRSMIHDHDEHGMGAHMRMSKLREPKPGDLDRAKQIVETARQSLTQYRDFRAAEADGYKIFLPQVKQKMYHFTNWKYAIEAEFRFNPEHPTSLLYEKKGENDYKLIGAMYTAPTRYSEDELDKRVPLGVAQWHQHVNMCQPPPDKRGEMWGKTARFGLAGSITTKEECDAAGGTFKPHVFGWMVHFYPDEKRMDDIWSVERQKEKTDMSGMMHDHH
jgi:hypothetical protein